MLPTDLLGVDIIWKEMSVICGEYSHMYLNCKNFKGAFAETFCMSSSHYIGPSHLVRQGRHVADPTS